MKYYFCDCEESMRLHEDGKLGDWAKREDIEKALRTSQDSAEIYSDNMCDYCKLDVRICKSSYADNGCFKGRALIAKE